MDVGQAAVDAVVADGQSFVVDAQLVQYGRVQVMHMHRVPNDVVALVIGLTMHQAGFHSSPGEHVTEATRMMIAPAVFLRRLLVDCSTKLTSPDDQHLVEQASLQQVGDQAGRRVIGVAALPGHVAREVGVMIPAHVKQLDKPHIALSQPPGQQAVRREGTRLFHVRSV